MCPEHGLLRLDWRNFENFSNRKFVKNHLSDRKKSLSTVCQVWSAEIFKIFQIENFCKKSSI